jgi:hypothetical protein
MYKNKYLKYKNKYLQLKNEISGGSGKAAAIAANRAYQATRAYAEPPVFPAYDERPVTGDYGLTHLAQTITKKPILHNIGSFLKADDLGQLVQTRKVIGNELREDAIAKAIHQQCFSRIPFKSMSQGRRSTEYLPDLVNDRSHKILLMAGGIGTNRVDMMIINDGNVEWKMCAPMIKNRITYSAYYCQGEVLSVSSYNCRFADGRGTSERYDVLSQTAVELEHRLPIPNLCDVAVAELNGKAFVIGGWYDDAATRRSVYSDRIFCLNMDQAGTWIEQESRLITARRRAAAATYQGKVWLAGGYGQSLTLTSIEVFDPLVGSWQAAGNLTRVYPNSIALFAIKDDLFAAGFSYRGMWVEKRDGQTGAWQLVSELNDGNRLGCALTACGSTIYFLGGYDSNAEKSWNSFDTQTNTWASQGGQYQDEATRQLPRNFIHGQAVCITPDEQLAVLAKYKGQLSLPEP